MTQPDPNAIDNNIPDGIMKPGNILFCESIGEITTTGAVNPDDENDELTQFLKDSFVFVFQGIKGVGEDIHPEEYTVAMPIEAVLFIITSAMKRMEEMPPEMGGGLIVPN